MKKLFCLFFVAFLAAWALELSGQNIALHDWTKTRNQLWSNWKKQLRKLHATEGLPRLPDLRHPLPTQPTATMTWQIPDSLEPQAIMKMTLGSKGEVTKQALPFFLYLHGSGPAQEEWNSGVILANRWRDAPAVYAVPRIPNEGDFYRWFQVSKQWVWERLLRMALSHEGIDPNRLYVLGISEGGYGSQRLASFYCDYWAGAGPMAGGEVLHCAPAENLCNLAFSLETGSQDFMYCRDTLTKIVGEELDSLSKLYPKMYLHHVHLQAGRGHGIEYSPTTPWLSRFRRVPRPLWWRWEAFPMGGQYRKGCFNLRIDQWERPAAPSPHEPHALNHYDGTAPRRFHEMHIEGNTVHLRIDKLEYHVRERDPRWGIALRFDKQRTPATNGKYTLFLSPDMVDASKAVRIVVNGKEIANEILPLRREHMQASLETWGDPERIFPMAVSFAL